MHPYYLHPWLRGKIRHVAMQNYIMVDWAFRTVKRLNGVKNGKKSQHITADVIGYMSALKEKTWILTAPKWGVSFGQCSRLCWPAYRMEDRHIFPFSRTGFSPLPRKKCREARGDLISTRETLPLLVSRDLYLEVPLSWDKVIVCVCSLCRDGEVDVVFLKLLTSYNQ